MSASQALATRKLRQELAKAEAEPARTRAEAMVDVAAAKPRNEAGAFVPEPEEAGEPSVDNISTRPRGTGSSYLAARIARDRPDVLERGADAIVAPALKSAPLSDVKRELARHGGKRNGAGRPRGKPGGAAKESGAMAKNQAGHGKLDYWVARLEREGFGEEALAVRDGTKSARAAAYEHGWRKPPLATRSQLRKLGEPHPLVVSTAACLATRSQASPTAPTIPGTWRAGN